MKLVVFDLDGTLYDKRGLSLRMVLHALGDVRKMQAERKTRASMKGQWLGDEKRFYQVYFKRLAERLQCSPECACQWYESRYMPLMVRMIGKYQPLNAKLLPILQECKENKIKMVVLSDYGHAKEKLEVLGLEPEQFDWIVSAPELGGLKPATELLRKVADKMGIDPTECLVVGDREDTDGDMARATGAKFYKVGDKMADFPKISDFGT